MKTFIEFDAVELPNHLQLRASACENFCRENTSLINLDWGAPLVRSSADSVVRQVILV